MRLLAALLLTASASVAAQPGPPAPVDGERADLDRFVGEWAGGYECEETGRRGTLEFRLAAGADSVEAAVWMIPHAAPGAPRPAPVPLAVHAVEVRTSVVIHSIVAMFIVADLYIYLGISFAGIST